MLPGNRGEFWRGRSVFITGNTGFKGSWLSLWLARCGARVHGYALPAEGPDFLFDTARLAELVPTTFADIREAARLQDSLRQARPSVVFHLAAQPLVRRSYAQPLETFEVNVSGTCNLLEAARQTPGVEAVVVVTTDKCYRNHEQGRPFREEDELGGYDPYSASKAAAEIATAAFRQSYFEAAGIGLATARAGNVIGGGDWCEDRLVPDVIRAARADATLLLRHPGATRPWQHVLDCLNGYLMLAEALVADRSQFSRAWNFGPTPEAEAAVQRVIDLIQPHLPFAIRVDSAPQPHEAARLTLDSSLARARLGWHGQLDLQASVDWTACWYAHWLAGQDARALTAGQIDAFCKRLAA